MVDEAVDDGPGQPGHLGEQPITVGTDRGVEGIADDVHDRHVGDVGVVTELLALVNVGDVHFDEGQGHAGQRCALNLAGLAVDPARALDAAKPADANLLRRVIAFTAMSAEFQTC